MNQVEKSWQNQWIKCKNSQLLIDDGREDAKSKGTKKCAIKRKLKFENYKNCLEVN